RPRVSGRVQTQPAVANARTSGTPRPPAKPYFATKYPTTTGARNCTPRAALYVTPIAELRIYVGNSSANSAPKPAVQPEPSPSANKSNQNNSGVASNCCQ